MLQEVLGFPGEMLWCCSQMNEVCREVCWSLRLMPVSPGKMLAFLKEVSAYAREVSGRPGKVLCYSKIPFVCSRDTLFDAQGRIDAC